MMKIFSATQIRGADAYTFKHEPVASIDLMERAAIMFMDELTYLEIPDDIVIFCGPGNNGGDGLAIARLLIKNGTSVKTYIVSSEEKYSDDFKKNLIRLKKNKKAKIAFIKNEKQLPALIKNETIIDALFGTGLNKPVDGIFKKVIQHINQSGSTVISVDIPSGLFADRCSMQNSDAIVRAAHTFSFQFYKLAFMFAENAQFFGKVHVVEIGLSQAYISKTKSDFEITDEEIIKAVIRPRDPFSHKGNYGHALLIAGSKGKMGAAVLAAKACLRSGVGLLTVQIPKCGYTVLQTAVPEAMCIEDENDSYITSQLMYDAYNAIGIGPGINTVQETAFVLQQLLASFTKPMVIDADALNIISQNKTWLKKIPANSILTPHPKEFERLFGKTQNNFERNQLQRQCSKKYNVVIVLKGKYTCITSPDGKCFFNPTGNAGMAKGGSGDVLTGMITALLAQSHYAFDAAVAGVYLHGLAGDVAAKRFGEHSVLASDIVEGISMAFEEIHY